MSVSSKRARMRGGASVPCPVCGQPTTVVFTRRRPARKGRSPSVGRLRVCTAGHKFHTEERAKRTKVSFRK